MHILTEGRKQETLGDLIKVLSDGGLCLDGLTNILASEIAEIELKVKNAAVDNDPTPYIYLENVFSANFYQRLLKSVDGCAAQYDDPRNSYSAWAGDGEHYLFAEREVEAILRSSAGALILEAIALRQTMKTIGALAQSLVDKFRQWIPECNLGVASQTFHLHSYFMRDESGYGIKPHTEGFTTVLTAMIYLPYDDRLQEHGTILYKPKEAQKTCYGRGEYLPLYPESQFETAKLLPFRRNALMAFVKTPRSWHGLPSIGSVPYSRNSMNLNVHNPARKTDQGLIEQLTTGRLMVPAWEP